MSGLFDAAQACLQAADPAHKLGLTHVAAAEFAAGVIGIVPDAPSPEAIRDPGRPARLRLVAPRDLPQRGLGSDEGRAAFLHAIAHIEFNAINLAWDAVYRFRGMPAQYYADWVSVADDEARHYGLLSQRLREYGREYGDFEAHKGLWDMAEKTADSCLARMALVPRVLEARGLDVTPAMILKLRGLGDDASADILELILREEVRHVEIGSHWFAWCCEREGREPRSTFRELIRGVAKGSIRGPFNHEARRRAGFSEEELAMLTDLSRS
ncbi:ferritin-like domain-containing protein [Arenimonas sp.]|uniref:ferritin-like domain-containing protein n=1 Tax=Arenimonas sp. TaxID=1872635 RepID=UPI0039E62946